MKYLVLNPLQHEACNHGYTDIVRLLLDHGAVINMPGFDHDTPLHDAVSNYRVECVKLLVSRGASLTGRSVSQSIVTHELTLLTGIQNVLYQKETL